MVTKDQRQELRNLAERVGGCNWGGLGSQTRTFDPNYTSKMNFIAAASPAVLLALLDRLDEVEPLVEACEFLGQANRAKNGGDTGAFRDGIDWVIAEEQKLSGLPFEGRDDE